MLWEAQNRRRRMFVASAMAKMTYKEAASSGLLMSMERDENVFLMGEGVDGIRGVYGQVLPAFKRFGEHRVVDTPLSENGLTGIAIGAALNGLRPVLIHQRNDFMLLAMDQMFNQAAKLGFASGGKHKIPIAILSFIARKTGEGVQHSQSLQAIFAHFPGVKVGMPATPADAKGMIITAISDDEPVIILEHCLLLDEEGFVPEAYYRAPFGASVVAEGDDVTIVALSVAVKDALKAAEILKEKGVSAEVIDLRWVRPLDIDTIAESAHKTGRLLVVDIGWKEFGVSSEVICAVLERGALDKLKAPPARIGLPGWPCPASKYLVGNYHPSSSDIATRAFRLAANR